MARVGISANLPSSSNVSYLCSLLYDIYVVGLMDDLSLNVIVVGRLHPYCLDLCHCICAVL